MLKQTEFQNALKTAEEREALSNEGEAGRRQRTAEILARRQRRSQATSQSSAGNDSYIEGANIPASANGFAVDGSSAISHIAPKGSIVEGLSASSQVAANGSALEGPSASAPVAANGSTVTESTHADIHTSRIRKLEEKLEESKKQLELSKNTASDQEAQLVKLQKVYKNLAQKNYEGKQALAKQAVCIQELNQQAARAQQEMLQKNNQIDAAAQEITGLEANKMSLAAALAAEQHAKQILTEEHHATVEQLKNKEEALAAKDAELNKTVLDAEVTQAEQLARHTAEKTHAQQTIQDLQEKVLQQTNHMDVAAQKIAELEANKAHLVTALAAEEHAKQILTEEHHTTVEQLKNREEALAAKDAELSKTLLDAEAIQTEQLARHTAEKTYAQQTIQDLQAEVLKQNKHMDVTAQKIAELEANKMSIEAALTAEQCAKQALAEEHRVAVAQHHNEAQQSQAEIAQIRDMLTTTQDKLKQLEAEKEGLEKKQEADLLALNEIMERNKTAFEKNEAFKAEVDDLQKGAEKDGETIEDLQATIKEQKNILLQLTDINNRDYVKKAELISENNLFQGYLDQDELELAAAERQLEEQRVHYEKRLQSMQNIMNEEEFSEENSPSLFFLHNNPSSPSHLRADGASSEASMVRPRANSK